MRYMVAAERKSKTYHVGPVFGVSTHPLCRTEGLLNVRKSRPRGRTMCKVCAKYLKEARKAGHYLGGC